MERQRKRQKVLVAQLSQGAIVHASRDEHFAFVDFVSAHDDVAPYIGPQFVAAHVRDRLSFCLFQGGYVAIDPLGQGVLDVHIAVLPNYRKGPSLTGFLLAIHNLLTDHAAAMLFLRREGEHAMCAKCEVPMATKAIARFDRKNLGAYGIVRRLGFTEIDSSTDRDVWQKEIPCPLE